MPLVLQPCVIGRDEENSVLVPMSAIRFSDEFASSEEPVTVVVPGRVQRRLLVAAEDNITLPVGFELGRDLGERWVQESKLPLRCGMPLLDTYIVV